MRTIEITAKHITKEGENKEASGTCNEYDVADVDEKNLPYVVERANQMIKIRAQDELRQTLVDEDPAKAVLKKLRASMKADPEGFKTKLEEAGLSHLFS